MATLADKVWGTTSIDEAALDAGGRAADELTARNPDGPLSLDKLDYGVIFGIAWAIARSEDPWASNEAIGEAAKEAAADVWRRYAGGRMVGEED